MSDEELESFEIETEEGTIKTNLKEMLLNPKQSLGPQIAKFQKEIQGKILGKFTSQGDFGDLIKEMSGLDD